MLDEILENFDPTPAIRPSKFDTLCNQLPDELKYLVKQCRSGLMIALGISYMDVGKLDRLLSKTYQEYNYEECTYKGEPCSMSEFIRRKFGQDVANVIKQLTTMGN